MKGALRVGGTDGAGYSGMAPPLVSVGSPVKSAPVVSSLPVIEATFRDELDVVSGASVVSGGVDVLDGVGEGFSDEDDEVLGVSLDDEAVGRSDGVWLGEELLLSSPSSSRVWAKTGATGTAMATKAKTAKERPGRQKAGLMAGVRFLFYQQSRNGGRNKAKVTGEMRRFGCAAVDTQARVSASASAFLVRRRWTEPGNGKRVAVLGWFWLDMRSVSDRVGVV